MKELKWVRFPNESTYQEIEIDMNDFKVSLDLGEEKFGWLNGTFVTIKDITNE
jgi:hypothetical protein